MTEIGDDFIGRGQFSTVLFIGVVGFESNCLQTRLVSCLFCCLLVGGIWWDDVFSTVLWVSGVTVMAVL